MKQCWAIYDSKVEWIGADAITGCKHITNVTIRRISNIYTPIADAGWTAAGLELSITQAEADEYVGPVQSGQDWFEIDPPPGDHLKRCKIATVSGTTLTLVETVVNGVWDHGAKTLTKAGAFADFDPDDEHLTGMRIWVRSGTGVTPGEYEIDTQVDEDTIVLKGNLTSGTDPTDVDATLWYVATSNQTGVDGEISIGSPTQPVHTDALQYSGERSNVFIDHFDCRSIEGDPNHYHTCKLFQMRNGEIDGWEENVGMFFDNVIGGRENYVALGLRGRNILVEAVTTMPTASGSTANKTWRFSYNESGYPSVLNLRASRSAFLRYNIPSEQAPYQPSLFTSCLVGVDDCHGCLNEDPEWGAAWTNGDDDGGEDPVDLFVDPYDGDYTPKEGSLLLERVTPVANRVDIFGNDDEGAVGAVQPTE